MHSFLLSLSVLVGFVSAAVSRAEAAGGYVDVASIAGSIEPDHISATLSVDLEEEKHELIIALDIGATDRECSDSNLHINGLSLTLAAPKAGRFQFSAPTRGGDGQTTFEAAGSLTCLRGEASLVDLRIYDLEQPETPIIALVFSYSQVGQPILHRLLHGSPEALALHLTTLTSDLSTWTHPVHDVIISETVVDPSAQVSDLPEGLEAQLLRLDLLKHHAEDIQKEIKATEAKIMSIWKSEFAKCNSIGCYLKTAVAKAPTLAHLIASHLSHHTHIDAEFFRNSTHMNCTMEVEKVVEQHEKQMVLVNLADEEAENDEEVVTSEPAPAVEDATEAVDDQADESSDTDVPAGEDNSKDEQDDSKPWYGGRPPWRHGPPGNGGPPPWARPGGRPPWAQGDKPPFGRPPWAKPGSRPPWATEENPTAAASGPSEHEGDTTYRFWPFSLTPQDRFKIAAFLGAAVIVSVFTLTLACCLCVRRGCMFLRDPRFKADCMARREERRTRALYRKAACKHRMRTILQRFRRPFSSSDYEEKRELLTNQDGEPAGILGPQLERLRTFHEFLFREVSRRAQEDSARVEQTQTQTDQPPAELDAAERASIRSETLPAYSLPPPSYRNGLGSEFSVVTGFTGYTPSGSEDTPDDSTASSIVDCSPRLSFESQRTGTTRTRE